MPIALDPKQTFDYVVKDDRDLPPEEQTVWHLRCLTIAEESALADNQYSANAGSGEIMLKNGSYQVGILRRGVEGVSNFKDANGNEQAVSKAGNGLVPLHFFDLLSTKHREEIATAILTRGEIKEKEGNS